MIVDPIQNILIDRESGEPLMIDFGRGACCSFACRVCEDCSKRRRNSWLYLHNTDQDFHEEGASVRFSVRYGACKLQFCVYSLHKAAGKKYLQSQLRCRLVLVMALAQGVVDPPWTASACIDAYQHLTVR